MRWMVLMRKVLYVHGNSQLSLLHIALGYKNRMSSRYQPMYTGMAVTRNACHQEKQLLTAIVLLYSDLLSVRGNTCR